MSKNTPTNIDRNFEQPASIRPEQLFEGYAWRAGTMPEALHLNTAGFTEDQNGYWYMVRKARQAVDLDSIQPKDLFNADHARFHNSSEGNGLYFGNTSRAVERVKISTIAAEPGELYVCRIKPEDGKVLDATKPLKAKYLGQKVVSSYLRYKSVSPLVVPLKTSFYDKRYADAEVIAMHPLAGARVLWTGRPVSVAGTEIPARWALVRNLSVVEVVAHRTMEREKK